MSVFEVIRSYSLALDDDRTAKKITAHLRSEVDEIEEEIAKEEAGEPAGEDGIIGEAIDVILCAVDLIVRTRPDMTEAEVEAYALKKCKKWMSKQNPPVEVTL